MLYRVTTKFTGIFSVLFALIALTTGCATILPELATFQPSNNGSKSLEELAVLNIQPASFKTRDGETLHSLYLPNPDSELLTIYFHGNGGNIHGRIGALEKLRDIGSSVFGVSYRGYLNSTGAPTEPGIYEDAKAALEYARSTLNFEEKNILVLGRSLGSAVALDLAQERNLFGIILVSPFTDSRAIFDNLGSIPRSFIKDKNNFIDTSFKNLEKSRKVLSRTLVIHGTADRIIPVELGEKVYKALPGRKKFVRLEGADHNRFGFSDSSEADKLYWAAVGTIFNGNEF